VSLEVGRDGQDELIGLERAAWAALSSDGEAAAAFYSDVLADEVIMVLPGGLVIDDRSTVIESMRGAPWSSFELTNERVFELTDSSAVVTYQATAVREGNEYKALFNSTYVRQNGSWKLALHQQTPI
jgi:hypothetical protein